MMEAFQGMFNDMATRPVALESTSGKAASGLAARGFVTTF